MPTSNDTRVRVDGRSKIIASVLPFERLLALLVRLQLRLHGGAQRPACCAIRSSGSSLISRKWRTDLLITPPPSSTDRRTARRRRARAAARIRSISASVTISGARNRTTLSPAPTVSKFLIAQRVDQIARRHHGLDADQKPLAAHFREHGRIAVDHGGQFLLEQQRHLLHVVEEAGLQHHVEHGIGGTRSPADCRRRSSRASPASCRRRLPRWQGTRRSENRRRALSRAT